MRGGSLTIGASTLGYAVGAMPDERFVPSLAGDQIGGEESDFLVIEWTDSGDSGYDWIAPLHVHHADDEAWYVLDGALRVRLDDEVIEAGPGAAVFAAKGTP